MFMFKPGGKTKAFGGQEGRSSDVEVIELELCTEIAFMVCTVATPEKSQKKQKTDKYCFKDTANSICN